MRCSKARRLIIKHIDGEISGPEDESTLILHLDKCKKCNARLSRLKGASLAACSLKKTPERQSIPDTIKDNMYSFVYQQAMIPPPLIPGYVPRLVVAAAAAVFILFIGFNALWAPMQLPFIDVIGDVAYLDKASGRWEAIPDMKSLSLRGAGKASDEAPPFVYKGRDEAISSQSRSKVFSLKAGQIFLTKHKSVLIASIDNLGKLTAAPNSMFWCEQLRKNRLTGARDIRLVLRRGTLFIRKDKLPAGSVFLVETPSLTARALGTSFLVTAADDNNSRVTVKEGRVKVAAPKLHRGHVTLEKKESISAEDFKKKNPQPTEASERELMKIERFSGGANASIRTDDPLDKYRVTDYLDEVGWAGLPTGQAGSLPGDWSSRHKIEFQFEETQVSTEKNGD